MSEANYKLDLNSDRWLIKTVDGMHQAFRRLFWYTLGMELIEISESNISDYLEDCVALQEHLVKPGTEISPDLFVETAKDDHSYFIGVILDKKLIGMGVISKVVHPARINGYVNNIVVHPDGRGKGLFRVIMDDLELKAKNWNCSHIDLTCSREEVQGMYVRRGYIHKETNFYILKLE